MTPTICWGLASEWRRNWWRSADWSGFGNHVNARSNKPPAIALANRTRCGESADRARCAAALPRFCVNCGIGGKRKRRQLIARRFIFCRTRNCFGRPPVLPPVRNQIIAIFQLGDAELSERQLSMGWDWTKPIGRYRDAASARGAAQKLTGVWKNCVDGETKQRRSWIWSLLLWRPERRWNPSLRMRQLLQRFW